MPKELDELEVEGESETVEDEVEDEVEDGDEDATQLVPPAARPSVNPMDNMVPIERFNEVNGQLQETRQLLGAIASRLPQTAPAQAARPTYTRPGDPEDVNKWRGFVGETVDPAVQAAKAEIKQYVDNIAAQAGEAIDLQNVRAEFPDYDRYAPQVEQLRTNFARQTGQPVQRRWAYLAVRGNEALQAQNGTAKRAAAIKRTSAASTTPSKAPAAGQRPRTGMPRTRADVNAMTLKQMEDVLGNTPL